MSINISTNPSKNNIRVGYIDPKLGYVDNVTISQANVYAKNNPRTKFIFRDGNNVLNYLSINQVNQLKENKLLSTKKCEGIQNKEIETPLIKFSGGGGVGAIANPVIGTDGSILAVDLVYGGNGYQYPPIVSADDFSGFGSGAVFEVSLGEIAKTILDCSGFDDIEEYDDSDSDVPDFGRIYGQNGNDLGKWNPRSYLITQEDPSLKQVEDYIRILNARQRTPFWTTRKRSPDRLYSDSRRVNVSRVYNDSDSRWDKFLSNYGISPIPRSRVVGSDYAGITFTMEWDENFPNDGEYVFRGLVDNSGTLYIDNKRVATLGSLSGPVKAIKKTITRGEHTIKLEILNAPGVPDPANSVDNPLAVALTIDAPPPPIPKLPPVIQDGPCPPTPFWTTRFQNSENIWYPAISEKFWQNFMNRYAISPVPPLSNGDNGIGRVFKNSWTIDAPYSGTYGFRGTADYVGKFFVDGVEIATLESSKTKKPKLVRFSLSKGPHKVEIQVQNDSLTATSPEQALIINYIGLNPSNRILNVRGNNVLLKDGAGDDTNATFSIVSSDSGVNAKISSNGRRIEYSGSGKITVKLTWDDNPRTAGVAVQSIRVGGVTLTQRGEKGSETKSFIVGSNETLTQTSTPTPDFVDVTFNISTSSGNPRELKSTFVSEDGSHSFTINASLIRSNKRTEVIKVKPNVNYRVLGSSGSTGVEQGTLVNRRKGGRSSSNTIFIDRLGSSNDFNDLVITSSLGTFVPGNSRNVSTGRITFDLTYRVNDNVLSGIIPTIPSPPPRPIPWGENPIGVSAIIIAPCCPKNVGGRGVVDRVIPIEPGTGYPTLTPEVATPEVSVYPVALILKEVIVENPGVNYCEKDEIKITPSNGAELDYIYDSFGRITEVKVLNPGFGFTEFSTITITGLCGGVNAKFRPVFEIIRDPIVVDESKLIQVTDLVGLKQTGYISGRPYYGSVFFKDNIKFAGFYETVGDLVQVYDTLKESIDAQVTTPPSAIQRQGTDVTSNDPRLNIPGTPQNLI
jgi:hypothetical protein